MPGFLLFLRARRVLVLFFGISVSFVLFAIVPGTLQASLITANWTVVPLLSVAAVPGVIWGVVAASPGKTLENSLPGGRLRGYRLLLLGGAVTSFVIVGAVALNFHVVLDTQIAAVFRNIVFGVGVASLSAVLLGRELAWVPLTSYAVLNWMAGTRDLLGEARNWALLNADASSGLALAITFSVFVVGGAAYTFADGRGNR